MTLEEHITIEEILAEANSHGLKAEVQEWANKFLKQGYDIESAYNMAFQEWVK